MKVQETKIGNSIIEVYDDCILDSEELEKLLKKSGISRAKGRESPTQMASLDPESKKEEVKLA
ncbi:hypothetical protein [Lacrimispora sp.]|uniref:hypothetical protein n=1 Tax=Lacrimispora sp. TaxID=2719234 RepID=UPI0039919C0A